MVGLSSWLAVSPAAAVTLEEAFTAALRHHPERILAQWQTRLGEGYLRQSESWLAGDPAVEAVYRDDGLTDERGYREIEGTLALPLWQPGQRAARRTVGERTVELAEAERALLRWQVWRAVLERYWPLRRALAEQSVAQTLADSASALIGSVRRRVKAGELARTELLLARQERMDRELALQNARARMVQAERAWSSFTGLEDWPRTLRIERVPHDEPSPAHPRLRVAQAALAQAEAVYDDQLRRRRSPPELTLWGKHDRGASGEPWDTSLGIGLRVPFGMAAPAAPAEAQAALERARALAGLERVRREVALAVEQARLEMGRAEDAVKLAERRAALARERLKMSARAFELGETDLHLLIQARGKAAEAQRVLENARIDLDKAVLEFNLAVGEVP